MGLKQTAQHTIRSLGWHVSRYDPDASLAQYLHTLFAHFRINCVLDVGARFGEYGCFLRRNGYTGEIISFEPIEASFKRLKEASSGDSHWRVHQHALGSQNSTLEINVTESSDFASFLTPNEFANQTFSGNQVVRMETVPVLRLDEVLRKVTAHIPEPRIYLKMDTQGWDREVFCGAVGCHNQIVALQSEVPFIPLYEGMPHWQEVITEYQRNGFALSAMFKVTRDRQMRVIEMDCVMVRSEET